MDKNFDDWNDTKQLLNSEQNFPFFNEGQIWWCSVGINVGFEILGKSGLYTRPVLILRKYGKQTFFGLPMTSRRKDRDSHYHFDFDGVQGSIILDQGRTMDVRRLADRMGELPERQFQKIRTAFKKFH